MPHLTLGNQIFYRTGDFLDRHVGIDAMLVEEVDMVCAKPFQASLSRSLDVAGTAVRARAALAGLGIDIEAELRSNHNLFADRLKSLTYQFLICEGSIGFGRIEEGDSLVVS